MSIEERISLLEERVAEILFKHDKLVQLHELLAKQYTELREEHHQFRVQTEQYKGDMEAKINLLCSLIGIPADQLTGNLNLFDFPDLLRKRADEQRN